MKISKHKRKTFLLIYLLAVLLISLIITSFFIWSNFFNQGLIFAPNKTVYYKTFEYDITAFTNNFGFRDRNFPRKKHTRIRILVLGDSFTYGWGVNLDQTWTKILERKLRNKGLDAEVLNLGFPMGNFFSYYLFAKKAIPFLRPDIVLMAYEQGGDVAQLKNCADDESNYKKLILVLKNLDFWKDNIMASQINFFWREAAKEKILLAPQKGIFLDEEIKKLLLAGNLNPALLGEAIRDRKFFYYGFSDADEETHELIIKMDEYIRKINSICKKNGARFIVLAAPMGPYCSVYQHKILQRQGLYLTADMLTSHKQDEVVEKVCNKYQIKFYQFTDKFRVQDRVTPLYYYYDGHYNPRGHAYFAALTSDIMSEYLESVNLH